MSVIKKLVLISSLALLLSGCNQEKVSVNTSDSPFKIGVVLPLSGDAAAYGEETKVVLEQTLKTINSESKKVELFYEDGKCSGTDAVTAYQKLRDINKVQAILGGVCSSESLAMAPFLEADQIVALSGGSSSPDIEGASPYLYTLAYNDNIIAEQIAASVEGKEKVAIITEQNDYNIGIQKVLETLIPEQIVSNEVFVKGSVDFRNIIQKSLNEKPDALVLNPNIGATADNLLKQLSEFKDELEDTLLVTQIAYLSEESRANAPEVAEGMLVVDSPNITSQEMVDFKASLTQSTDNLGDFMTATMHDALLNLSISYENSIANQSSILVELTQNPLIGIIAGGKSFDGKNFLQGIQAGVFEIKDQKATLTNN